MFFNPFNPFGVLTAALPLQAKSRAYDLKTRLDWGEPALTIIDARDRALFLNGHITGAVSMPASKLVQMAQRSLELDRDIYIYADTDEETAQVADQLRQAGYQNVAELRGGFAAWKAMGYPIEALHTLAG